MAVRILRKIIFFKTNFEAIRRFFASAGKPLSAAANKISLQFALYGKRDASARLTALDGLRRRQYARLSAFRSFASNLANRHLLDFRKICLKIAAHKNNL